jgi:hypothetical protein
LKEYNDHLDCIKDHFKQYETHVERWFYSLPIETKNRHGRYYCGGI